MRALPQLPSPTGTAIVDPRTVDLAPVQGRLLPEPPAPPSSGGARYYPWLLMASTGLAAVFCVLYLTKPVVVSATSPGLAAPPPAAGTSAPALAASAPRNDASAAVAKQSSLLPDANALPGEVSRPVAGDARALGSANANPYEQTNLRIQHVLSAQGPVGEDLGRIVLDVPVLYRSRALRWTPQEIARARQIMAGIADYQDKSRALREEGTRLLTAWDQLIGSSIPNEVLRADSPTLPAAGRNTGDGQDTIYSIEIDR